MDICSLGYAGVDTTDMEGWRQYGSKLLGMQIVPRERADSFAFRMDKKAQRILIEQGTVNGGAYYGLEVADAMALEIAQQELAARGIHAAVATPEELKHRSVEGMIHFPDPIGTRLELYYGLANADDPFVPGRPISGFRTGELGFGHAVLNVTSTAEVLPFYTDVLGFRLSDYAEEPFKATFLHTNARHHSFALIESGRTGLHHLMVEVLALDDVGQAYDRAQLTEGLVGATLGRHTNDHMTSFYSWSPSKFLVEYGWGGRSIDEANWQPECLEHGPSLWGHERVWLSGPTRQKALEMRLRAASAGQRAPIHASADAVDLYTLK
jgi:2,3-dihydroxybiphenyl 1,2-dioxygenase